MGLRLPLRVNVSHLCTAETKGGQEGLSFRELEELPAGKPGAGTQMALQVQALQSASQGTGPLSVKYQPERFKQDCSALKTRPLLCPQIKTNTALETD